MSDPFALFLSCPAGVEPLLAAEATALGGCEVKERRGGVGLLANLDTAYRVCLWSRLASRVLMPLADAPAGDADALYAMARQIDWPALFEVDRRFAIEVAGRTPGIANTQFAALRVKDAIVDRFRETVGRRPDVDVNAPDLRIHLHLDKRQCTVSLDLSGESLHRRGWRGGTGDAPLKENLACAILVRAGWPAIAAQGGGLVDPMCGSGTLVIEAALMAADSAPGLLRRHWGFEAWSGHRPERWGLILDEARQRSEAGIASLPPIRGSDIDANVVDRARRNARSAGLGDRLRFDVSDVSRAAADPGAAPGLVVCNPPYGERLGAEGDVIKLMSLLGSALRDGFPGWRSAVFTGRPDLAPRIGLRAASIHALYNGRLPCKLLCFDVPAKQPEAVTGGEEFANRLAKNLRHLGKWARRQEVANYRVYDADLPAYALSLDVYESDQRHVHVHEYAAPSSIDPVQAERRLREALTHASRLLDVSADRLHFRQRRAQKGSTQYQRQGESGRRFRIVEHGVPLWVNFDDYMDSGLFLDHRPLRLRIQREATDKRFLNLFCYTASATAHAVRGGAASSMSVDLSNTYLEWARDNLRLAGVEVLHDDGRQQWGHVRAPHRLLRADCLEWLHRQALDPRRPRFDLILCDPPTFSNSKKMEGVLDTQRDHVRLIRDAVALLAPGGVLYFSTNRRRFELDNEALSDFAIQDITATTLDEDFRRPPPAHRCWRIMSRA